MAILRQTGWIDGEIFPGDDAFFLAIQRDDGRCVFCDAEQPNDIRWPNYVVELQLKDDEDATHEFVYRVCLSCEPKMDEMFCLSVHSKKGAQP